jgi:hypothetical protein
MSRLDSAVDPQYLSFDCTSTKLRSPAPRRFEVEDLARWIPYTGMPASDLSGLFFCALHSRSICLARCRTVSTTRSRHSSQPTRCASMASFDSSLAFTQQYTSRIVIGRVFAVRHTPNMGSIALSDQCGKNRIVRNETQMSRSGRLNAGRATATSERHIPGAATAPAYTRRATCCVGRSALSSIRAIVDAARSRSDVPLCGSGLGMD